MRASTHPTQLSAYGTLDQGGNVWQWNDSDIKGDGSLPRWRGWSWSYNVDDQVFPLDYRFTPFHKNSTFGFRVAGIGVAKTERKSPNNESKPGPTEKNGEGE